MKRLGFFSILLVVFLFACSSQIDTEKIDSDSADTNLVVLDEKSSKFGYISESKAVLTQRPLLDHVTGKITYDETRTVRVSSPISGRVIGKIAEVGLQVNVGDVLVELDSPELGQVQATYEESLADLEMARNAYQRVQLLFENDIAPKKALDEVEDLLVRARSETERNRLRLANLGIYNRQMDGRFVLRAPLSGTVTERNINPGMEVKPDLQLPLFVVSDLSRLWVMIDVPEKDIGLIHQGARILASVPAYPGETFVTAIDYISQVVNETSHTVKVRSNIQNETRRLLPAMFVNATVLSDSDEWVIVIPATALLGKTEFEAKSKSKSEPEFDWIYIHTGNHRYQKRRVVVEQRTRNQAVIREGLEPGERFVTDVAQLLHTEQVQHTN